jgi:transitional endoplasmic reticulum ATPase
MADTNSLVPQKSAFDAYSSHSSGNRVNTDAVIQRALLDQYPDHCLIATHCDLIKYAEAGYATARLADSGFPHIFCRDYEASVGGIDDENPGGMLKTSTAFACYNFDWRGNSLLVYVVDVYISPIGRCDVRNYILTKSSSEMPLEPHNDTMANALIRAAGIWEERSDNEVWVYDLGRWTKDRELWLNVQRVSREDVVLRQDMWTALKRDILGFYDAKQHFRELGIPWKVQSLTQLP